MTKLYTLLLSAAVLTFFTTVSHAQVTITENDTTVCLPQSFTLHATVDSSQTGAGLIVNDDFYSQIISLGFPFTFYGYTYTKCKLSTNAYIKFDTLNPGGASPWVIVNTAPFPTASQSSSAPGELTNVVMGPWQDTYPGASNTANLIDAMNYKTVGVAPNRIFVFSFCQVPMFSCTDSFYSGQMMLFETSNIVEVHIAYKSVCASWNGGQAVLGLQDPTGQYASIVPGHNVNTQWTASNKAWRFTPTSNTTYVIDSIPYNPIPIYAGGGVTWYDNGVSIGTSASGAPFTHSYGTGVHHVVAEVNGCYSATATDTVIITIGATSATFSQNNLECPTASNGFAAVQLQPGLPFGIHWTDSSGTVLSSDSGFIQHDTLHNVLAGTYHLIVIDTVGCVTNHTFNITASTYVANFDFNPSAIVCQGSPVSFSNTSNETVTSYNWNFGDGGTSTQPTTAHTFNSSGSFAVTLTITNSASGCTDDTTRTVNVTAPIAAAFAPSGTFCAGDPLQLSDQSSPYPVQWKWYLGISGDSSSVRNPSFVYSNPGTYTATLWVKDSLCGTDTAMRTYTINPYPVVNIGTDTAICAGQTVVLNAGNTGDTYVWSTGGFTTQVISTSPTVTTTYAVLVNHLGCIAGDTMTVTIECDLVMPNAFTPNNDGLNDIFRPRGLNVINYEIHVYNRWGQEVYSITNGPPSLDKGWDGTINGKPAEIGTYSYYARALLINNYRVERTGNVTLIR